MTERPEYRLDRHVHGECAGVVEIMSVSALELDTTMPRRAALRAGFTVAGALTLLTACNDDEPTAPAAPSSSPTTATIPPVTTPPTTIPPTSTTIPPPVSTSKPAPKPPVRTTTRGGTESLPCPGGPVRVPPGKVCTCNCVPVGLG